MPARGGGGGELFGSVNRRMGRDLLGLALTGRRWKCESRALTVRKAQIILLLDPVRFMLLRGLHSLRRWIGRFLLDLGWETGLRLLMLGDVEVQNVIFLFPLLLLLGSCAVWDELCASARRMWELR